MRTPGPIVAVGLLLLAVHPLSARDGAPDISTREWNQARGNAYRTSVVDVEPVRRAPVETWRTALGGKLVSEPVTWAGTVYVVAAMRRRRELLAIEAATGEIRTRKTIPGAGRVGLAVWQGTVIVFQDGLIRGHPHLGGRFGGGWKVRGSRTGTPVLHGGRMFVPDEGEIVVRDTRTGKELARGIGGSGVLTVWPGPAP